MPPIARRSHTLPGTDPKFHEYRKYLSPMRYKGQQILASMGSCKHSGCNYSGAWSSSAAREVGMWKHRSEKVRDARLDYFLRRMKVGPDKAVELQMEFADKHSHTHRDWVQLVEGYIRVIAGLNPDDDALPDAEFITPYHKGVGAKAMALKILDQGYEV
jgi:hypothetical protein